MVLTIELFDFARDVRKNRSSTRHGLQSTLLIASPVRAEQVYAPVRAELPVGERIEVDLDPSPMRSPSILDHVHAHALERAQ